MTGTYYPVLSSSGFFESKRASLSVAPSIIIVGASGLSSSIFLGESDAWENLLVMGILEANKCREALFTIVFCLQLRGIVAYS